MKEIHQKIAQFTDGELHHVELEGFLLDIKKNPQLKNKITRYQRVSDALKLDDYIVSNDDFLAKITQGIEQEPHYLLPKQKVEQTSVAFWQKTSLAVAASVAIVAVVVFQQRITPEVNFSNNSQLIAENEIKTQQQPVQVARATRLSQHERLKAYLQLHSDDLYTHGSLTAHPMGQVASYSQD